MASMVNKTCYKSQRILKKLNKIISNTILRSHSTFFNENTLKTDAEKEFKKSETVTKTKKHCYKLLNKWKNERELAEDLAKNVVYNKDGIICFNKPYGLRTHPLTEDRIAKKKTVVETLNSSSAVDIPFSMECCKEELKKILNCDDLILIKTTERYSSGIVVYSTKQNSKLKNAFTRSKDIKMPPFKYLALVLGCYPEQSYIERVGIKLMEAGKNEKLPIIMDSFSKQSMKHGIVKPSEVHFKILATNQSKSASLVEIATTCRKWHFLQVYSCHKGIPILGDNLYGSRVQQILNKSVIISASAACNTRTVVPSSILHNLNLSEKTSSLIPLHLHLNEIHLVYKKNVLVISAPLPEHFQWTLHKLGLGHYV